MKEKKKDTFDFVKKEVREKRKYVRNKFGISEKKVLISGVSREQDLAMEILEQIPFCEDLRTPLTYEDLDKLCEMQSFIAIDNYCKAVKRRVA